MIGLLDCNNFFVSCERLFRPDLWAKPVAVLSSNDGCIVARSNEVKAMGIPMGLPLFQAKQLADMSQVTLFSSNFTLYRDISSRVMQTLGEEVGECEIYSIDEAFFAVSSSITEEELRGLRDRIMDKVGIPVSIGVAKTKTLAKVGSEIGKKNSEGVCFLSDEKWQAVAKQIDCGEIWNLGRSTAAKLKHEGINTAAEFMNLDRAYVTKRFGVSGGRIFDELRGLVVHVVGVNNRDVQQSIMSTRSFAEATKEKNEVESAIAYHVTRVAEQLREKGLLAQKMVVMARPGRHSDFSLRPSSRECGFKVPTNSTKTLLRSALDTFTQFYEPDVPYKKAGVVLSGLVPERFSQLSIFPQAEVSTNSGLVDKVSDEINSRFGLNTLRPAVLLSSGPKTSSKLRSQEYTTQWKDIPRVQAK